MAAAWQNPDGLAVKFGNYYNDPKNATNRALVTSTMGSVKEMTMDFDLSQIPTGTVSYASDLNNDGTLDGWTDEHPSIPANAAIVSVHVVMTTAAAGGTSFVVGTFRQTGAAISANSLVTATEGVLANVNAAGAKVTGAGALTTANAAGVGANNAWVGITTTGTFTAGKGKLVIRFIDPTAEAFSNT